MILCDQELIKRCDTSRFKHALVDPFCPENIQPASIDLTLDSDFIEYARSDQSIHLNDVSNTLGKVNRVTSDSYRITPQGFVLGCTAERIQVPNDMVGIVEGKSSLARLGLAVHITAGFLDPGFHGKVTLEFSNVGPRPIVLYAGLRICQVSFTQMNLPAQYPYGHPKLGSRYQDQQGTTESLYSG